MSQTNGSTIEARRATTRFLIEHGRYLDLTVRQLALLHLLAEQDAPVQHRDAATALGISKPAATRAADKLEQRGLIRRIADRFDKRNVLLIATPAGRRMALDGPPRIQPPRRAPRHAAATAGKEVVQPPAPTAVAAE